MGFTPYTAGATPVSSLQPGPPVGRDLLSLGSYHVSLVRLARPPDLFGCGQRPRYAESLGQFHEVFRADGVDLISTKKAYEMVCEVSAGLEDQRQREIKEDQEDQEDQEDKPLAVREKITGTMVVSIDAGKVPTRANERVDDDGNKNYDREYRDAKVATVSALEWDEKRAEAHCTKTSSVTGIEHADQFFPRIEVEMKRRSAELGTLILVVLGDGASWIWDRVADLAEPGQQVWYILDFWHACDHLAKICRVLYGEDTKPFTKQFKRWRRMLRKSGVAAVISELKQLRDSGSYPGAGDDIQKQINYFTTNKERMDYQRNRELRLPIGSGTVETACKNVVAARLKQSGMMWSVDGAKGMLQLRASLKSRRLMSDFDSLLPLSPTQETDLKAA